MPSTSLYKLTVRQHLALNGYSALVWLLVLVLLLKQALTFRHRDPNWRQRFALVMPPAPEGGWLFHCVSVGEVTAAAGLIRQLKQSRPDLDITVSTTTETGAKQVKQLLSDKVTHCYLPYDTGWAMQRFLRHLKPQRVIIMEVELWPNMMRCCAQRHIPVYLVNARMTERSATRYQSMSALFQPMLQALKGIYAQGERDYGQYRRLGAADTQLVMTGNLKFDIHLPDDMDNQRRQGRQNLNLCDRFIIIGGSTHEPEESALLDSYQRLKNSFPHLLLILVPRHPHRFGDVAELCQKREVNLVRLSYEQPCTEHTEVLLADQMGRLNELYSIADIAFIGGSLADRGGHNALEAAACGLPMMMGPNQYNNPVICQVLQQSGALTTVQNTDELYQQLRAALINPENRLNAGRAGKQTIANNSGAINKTMKLLLG